MDQMQFLQTVTCCFQHTNSRGIEKCHYLSASEANNASFHTQQIVAFKECVKLKQRTQFCLDDPKDLQSSILLADLMLLAAVFEQSSYRDKTTDTGAVGCARIGMSQNRHHYFLLGTWRAKCGAH